MEPEGDDGDSRDLVTETWFDQSGNPVMCEEGYVTRIRTMSKGKVISERWYDEYGNPVSPGGETYCRADYTYDKAGNVNREKYYDAEGNPVRCLLGYAIVYREFDAYNRVVYEKFYDTDGFAIMTAEGVVSYRYVYDDEGRMIQRTAYDYFDHEIPLTETP